MNDSLATRLLLSRHNVMTQKELARRAGIRRQYIGEMEQGIASNPTIDVISKIAEALGVRPEYLVGWSDDPLGEDRPANVAEGRVVYDAVSPQERRRVQEVVDIMHDLPADRQELAIRVLEEFRNAQRVRIVGE
jgi:transcriptional regulator with XRE-family HTH domain